MNKLVVKENKKLVLKKVIIYELRNISLDRIQTEMNEFLNKVKLLKVNSFGPLVTKSYGTKIHNDGSITTDYDILLQAHDYKQYNKIYKIVDNISCPHCVYLKFDGEPQDTDYAYSKLDLYFYEHDLESNGIMYNVVLKDSVDHVIIDIFKPVVIA